MLNVSFPAGHREGKGIHLFFSGRHNSLELNPLPTPFYEGVPGMTGETR
jgi:hypothetical protein